MKTLIHLSFIFILFSNSLMAFEKSLNPTPQSIHFTGKYIESADFQLKTDVKNTAYFSLVSQLFSSKNNNKQKISVFIGTKNDKFAKKFIKKIPKKSEGYFLSIDKKNIYIIGNDVRGTYYGIRTLEQLLKLSQLPICEVIDFPDLTSRGVVEGFYGTPWSHEKRLRQLDFYGKFKLNTYIYGPKDDPYHSSPHWRKPYPEAEALQIKELVKKSEENFVDFVWAIHPGKDIKWNDEDRQLLLQKFQWMYDLGVRAFAVFFDDISGEGTNPERQAELLNYIDNQFIKKKKDVKNLIMCPTEYNKSWSDPSKRYLEILGEKLNKSIEIMWTGNTVVADIYKETLAWINPKIKRKAYIWWNFPVSDYVRNHLLLGAVYGNDLDIKDQMSGFVSNPMEHPEASKIAIYSVADYTWNLQKFNSDASWKNAIAELLPNDYEALLTFAKHNSDLGANGHKYRRVESVDFKPIAEKFTKEFDKFDQNSQLKAVTQEFEKIITSAKRLISSSENDFLKEEIINWVHQFNYLGERGLEVMRMYNALGKNSPDDFKKSYDRLQNIQQTMFSIDQKFNQNPYQPGIKVGTLIIEPFLNQTFEKLVFQYNQKYNQNLKPTTTYNPNVLITSIKRVENQPLLQRNKSLFVSPMLEYISVEKGQFIGIQFEEMSTLKSVFINLESNEVLDKVALQISVDGEKWETINHLGKNNQLSVNQEVKNINQIRIINLSDEKLNLKLNKFEVIFK